MKSTARQTVAFGVCHINFVTRIFCDAVHFSVFTKNSFARKLRLCCNISAVFRSLFLIFDAETLILTLSRSNQHTQSHRQAFSHMFGSTECVPFVCVTNWCKFINRRDADVVIAQFVFSSARRRSEFFRCENVDNNLLLFSDEICFQ